VRSFRNLADADLELPDAGCVVVGPNGHGKTSLIEALLYGEIFRSHRGAGDRELVRFGADGFWVQVSVGAVGDSRSPGGSGQVRDVAVGYDARTRAKRVTVDGAEPERLSDAIGIVRGVVLSPTDVRLVAGAPRERRHFLDVLLAITVRGYVGELATYRRALRHRVRSSTADVETWEHVLAESGAKVTRSRRAWVERWAAGYARHCVAVGESGEPALGYVSRVEGDGAEALREALAAGREKDQARGRTSVGPHRDELRLTLDGRSLRTFGSAGQQRTAALALRLLEAETLRELTGQPVTICLDDAFAELDEMRCRRLGALIERMAGDGSQVIAAVPREGEVPEVIGSLPRWGIRDGRISQ
jgi:DNA replication and repair protein RecF